MSDKLTITLTGRPPVQIIKEDWPILASHKSHDGQVECQANRTSDLIVRQHENGRTIVYGIYNSAWQGEEGRRRGQMVDGYALLEQSDHTQKCIDVIYSVAEEMEFGTDFAEQCIADLPAEGI